MTDHEAKEILEDIKGYEKTLDLIENHSISVQDACAIGINAIDKVEKYQQAIHDIKTEINSAYASSFVTRSDSTAFTCGLELAFDIITKYIKKVSE